MASADAIDARTVNDRRDRAAEKHDWHGVLDLLWRAATQWQRDNAMRLSAAVAMYTILSLSPLLVITIKVLAVAFGERAATTQVEDQVEAFLGPKGASAVEGMIRDASQPGSGTLATAISLGILLFTASGVFVELRDSLNHVWGVAPKEGRGWWTAITDRFQAMGLVFAVGFLLLVSQFVATALTAATKLFGEVGWMAIGVDLVVSTLVTAALFAILFKFLPDARIAWRDVALGAFVTAVLFKIGQYAQSLYFANFSTESAYGAAGSFIVVLLWVYYSCWIFFYGAELTQLYATRFGQSIEPSEDARRVRRGGDPANAPGE